MATAVPASLTEQLPAIEDALRAALADGPRELVHVSRYVMGWEDQDGAPLITGGKRIRPALCVFASGLFGGSVSDGLPGAVAVELIHNFSLVHDEVQDHDAERHHRPTVWALKGEGQAINAGDFLITRAFAALLSGNGTVERRMAALRVLNEAMTRMIAGQWADISFESRAAVEPEEYLSMIRGKTGALLGAPLAMGALLAGADATQAARLQEWGETVGLAFQVQDDYLGIWGDPNLTGKSNVNDIVRKKKTLPIVHGISSGRGREIQGIYEQDLLEPEDIENVVSILQSVGSDTFVRSEAEQLVDSANKMLADFELPSRALQQLRDVGRYLVERDR
ncbi:MAG: polyprenyl synthetase family protein [Dehalococcoidia bacterium]